MNKISPLAFILCLALAGMQVSAENWIKNADGALMDRHRLYPSGAGHLLL